MYKLLVNTYMFKMFSHLGWCMDDVVIIVPINTCVVYYVFKAHEPVFQPTNTMMNLCQVKMYVEQSIDSLSGICNCRSVMGIPNPIPIDFLMHKLINKKNSLFLWPSFAIKNTILGKWWVVGHFLETRNCGEYKLLWVMWIEVKLNVYFIVEHVNWIYSTNSGSQYSQIW